MNTNELILRIKWIYSNIIIKLLPKKIKSPCLSIISLLYGTEIIESRMIIKNKEVKNKIWKKQKPN